MTAARITCAFLLALLAAGSLGAAAPGTGAGRPAGVKIDKEALIRFFEAEDVVAETGNGEKVLGIFRPRPRGLRVTIRSRERITEAGLVVGFLIVLFIVRSNHYHRRKRIFIQNFSGK